MKIKKFLHLFKQDWDLQDCLEKILKKIDGTEMIVFMINRLKNVKK